MAGRAHGAEGALEPAGGRLAHRGDHRATGPLGGCEAAGRHGGVGIELYEAAGGLGRDTFVDTFAHLYPPADLKAFLEDSYTPAAMARFLSEPGQAIWLAEADGRAIGYVHAGPCTLPHPQAGAACGEVKRLYVRREAQNRGLGDELLRIALAWLEVPGRRLWVGVWSQNLGAQRLYRRHGFEKVGEYDFAVGSTLDHEFIMRRD